MHPWTKDLLKKHVEEVGGKVHTRFPPERNGVLVMQKLLTSIFVMQK
jgi:hypothetical protein